MTSTVSADLEVARDIERRLARLQAKVDRLHLRIATEVSDLEVKIRLMGFVVKADMALGDAGHVAGTYVHALEVGDTSTS